LERIVNEIHSFEPVLQPCERKILFSNISESVDVAILFVCITKYEEQVLDSAECRKRLVIWSPCEAVLIEVVVHHCINTRRCRIDVVLLIAHTVKQIRYFDAHSLNMS